MKTAETSASRRVTFPFALPDDPVACELLLDLWGEAADDEEYDDLAGELAEELEGVTEMRPTPDEIKAGCREIQVGWSPEERLKRLGHRRDQAFRPSGPKVYRTSLANDDPEMADVLGSGYATGPMSDEDQAVRRRRKFKRTGEA